MNPDQETYMLGVLRGYAEIPPQEWRRMSSRLLSMRVEKDGFFVRQGDRPSRLGFIVSGIFRVFCTTESGGDKTLAFRIPGQFLAAYTPFLENRDSWYSIQALTPGELIHLPLDEYRGLAAGHPCWQTMVKEYMVRLFMEKEDRERSFLTEDAKTRYLSFRDRFPELERAIPQFHIASYLGISPVSLSRIRGELKKNR